VRAVIQRVSTARVTIADTVVSAIGAGLLALIGIANDDTEETADWLIDKLLDLRIFENDQGKFDKSLHDIGGALLIVSQFTLLADTRNGRRPSFVAAARAERALPLYEHAVARARQCGVSVVTGEFGAHMQVTLVNDGPVTIVLDSRER